MPTATWERLGEERRNAVIAAAEQEFAAHGFSGGSLNVIAREAGVAKGSLFQYFHDKDDLYAHLADLASYRIRESMEVVVAEMDWAARPFSESMVQLCLAWVEYFRSHPIDLALTSAVNVEPDRITRSKVRGVVQRHYLEVLRPLMEYLISIGVLSEDVDLEALLAITTMTLPFIALATCYDQVDTLLGLSERDPDKTLVAVRRFVTPLAASFDNHRTA